MAIITNWPKLGQEVAFFDFCLYSNLYHLIGPNDLLLLESHHTSNMGKRTRQPSTDRPKILFYLILKNSYNLHLFKIFDNLHLFSVVTYISILYLL